MIAIIKERKVKVDSSMHQSSDVAKNTLTKEVMESLVMSTNYLYTADFKSVQWKCVLCG